MRQTYSWRYHPPMPIIEIRLRVPAERKWHGYMLAIVDSGADFTIVPAAVISLLNPPVLRYGTLSTQWQDRRATTIYDVDVQIGEIVLTAIEVAEDRQGAEVILGRNVLNLLDLRLNGPELQVELLTE